MKLRILFQVSPRASLDPAPKLATPALNASGMSKLAPSPSAPRFAPRSARCAGVHQTDDAVLDARHSGRRVVSCKISADVLSRLAAGPACRWKMPWTKTV